VALVNGLFINVSGGEEVQGSIGKAPVAITHAGMTSLPYSVTWKFSVALACRYEY